MILASIHMFDLQYLYATLCHFCLPTGAMVSDLHTDDDLLSEAPNGIAVQMAFL